MTRSVATRRAYAADWRDFRAWCTAHGVRSLPASGVTMAAYVDDLIARRRLATVRRRVAAVRASHVDAGHRSPTELATVRAALARAEWHGRDDRRGTEPLGVEELRAVSAATPPTHTGRRDRALLLVGYGAGLSPGELARLGLADVRIVRAGLRVETSRGSIVVPPGSAPELCAVRAWKEWHAVIARRTGAAFCGIDRHGRVAPDGLSVRGVTRVVQRAAARAGLDGARYSGLSLRRGMVLAATVHGATERGIMAQTGHRSRRLVRRYMTESTESSVVPGGELVAT